MAAITCDHCHQQLETCESVNGWRLRLTAESLREVGGVSIDIYILPPIDRDRYFCGVGCLAEWAKAEQGTWSKKS